MSKSSQSYKSSPEKIKERAEELVREGGITYKGDGVYIVPAQGNGKFNYKVDIINKTCECKYYETHHEKCKHIVAAEIISGVEDNKEEEEEINLEEVYQVSAGKVRNLSPECVALLLQSLAQKVVELESKIEELLEEREEKRKEDKRLLDKLCGID